METKQFDLIETKALDDDNGSFVALASVFGNTDHVGDRMMPGAFTKTLERWRASGDPIPVILSHQWDDPMSLIGKADPRGVYEDERGLVVQGQLDMENPVAQQVHKLMKERLLKGWSFGYTVPKGGQKHQNGANEVYEVDLVENGPTLKGANPAAGLEAIKSALEEQAEPEPIEELRAEVKKLTESIKALQEAAIKDERNEEPSPAKSLSQDPLRKRSRETALEVLSAGMSLREPPQPPAEEAPPPERGDLLRESREWELEILTGGISNDS